MKSASRTRSDVGRVPLPRGASSRRPPRTPEITRTTGRAVSPTLRGVSSRRAAPSGQVDDRDAPGRREHERVTTARVTEAPAAEPPGAPLAARVLDLEPRRVAAGAEPHPLDRDRAVGAGRAQLEAAAVERA